MSMCLCLHELLYDENAYHTVWYLYICYVYTPLCNTYRQVCTVWVTESEVQKGREGRGENKCAHCSTLEKDQSVSMHHYIMLHMGAHMQKCHTQKLSTKMQRQHRNEPNLLKSRYAAQVFYLWSLHFCRRFLQVAFLLIDSHYIHVLTDQHDQRPDKSGGNLIAVCLIKIQSYKNFKIHLFGNVKLKGNHKGILMLHKLFYTHIRKHTHANTDTDM